MINAELFAVRDNDGTQQARDRVHMDSQSLSFYADISGFLSTRLRGFEAPLSLLDIGPRTGAGLALLRLLHHPLSYAPLKLDTVTGIDIDPEFKRIASAAYPDIQALEGDAFALPEGEWDIVMSSHTIEHVDDPDDFVTRLTQRAKRYALIACPFEEQERIVWHKNTISYHFLTKHGFHDMQVYRSSHWFNSLCVIAGRHL